MERLFSTLLALRPDIRYQSLDAETHAVRGWRRRLLGLRTTIGRLAGPRSLEAA